MSNHLQAAINFSQVGADHLDNGRFERSMEYLLLAETAAAIAQAEAAEWQAQTAVRQALAAERQAVAMERIADILVSMIPDRPYP